MSSASYEDTDTDQGSQISDVEEQPLDEEEAEFEDNDRTPGGDFLSQLDWDPIAGESPSGVSTSPSRATHPVPIRATSTETTPLIQKKVSFTADSRPRRPPMPQLRHNSSSELLLSPKPHAPLRRTSTSSVKPPAIAHGGSTYGQSVTSFPILLQVSANHAILLQLFNSIAILLGIGMLSEPLAFSYAGWIAGTILIFLYGALTCYTAKILARIILEDHRLRSYSDIGHKAFGELHTPL